MSPTDEERFSRLVAEVASAGRVPLMRECVQHGQVSTWEHCVRVAHASLAMARALRLRVSERELVRAALLHDYFLYDWHEPGHVGHAHEDFDLSPLEENVIESHMWPLPPTRVPRSREAVLVCLADKWCSLAETLLMR